MQWAIRVDSAAYGESKALTDSEYNQRGLTFTQTPGVKCYFTQGVDERTQQGGNRTVQDSTRLGWWATLPGVKVEYPFSIATHSSHNQEGRGGGAAAYHVQRMAANCTRDEVYAGENASCWNNAGDLSTSLNRSSVWSQQSKVS